MRSYCAIYVDAGYLYASAATRVTGTSLRSGVRVDTKALIAGLIEQVEESSGLPLLRVNWYDSGGRPGGMPDIHQEDIGLLPRVKLRLGRLSRSGEQKGVDLRIGLDLATHSRHGVADIIYLVSGDDDLTEAVEEAQNHGVQVIILAVPGQHGRAHAVARHLQRESDGLALIRADIIDDNVKAAGHPPAVLPGEGEEAVSDSSSDVESAGNADAPVVGSQQLGAEQDENAQTPGDVVCRDEADHGGANHGATGDGEPGLEEPEQDETAVAPAATGQPASDVPADCPSAPVPAATGEDGTEVVPPDAVPVSDESAGASTSPRPANGAATPSIFATRRSSSVLAPSLVPPRRDGSAGASSTDSLQLVDEVVGRVVSAWCATATPDDVVSLRARKPFVPSDIDRTLLVDLASHLDDDEIDDATRHALRDRFWDFVERIRMR